MAANVTTLSNPRFKAIVIPREHGAWGMLMVPLLTGAVVGFRSAANGASLGLFLLAAISLFWLRTPVEAWLHTSAIKAQTPEERAFALQMSVGIGALAAISCGALLWNGRNLALLAIGGAAAVAFACQAAVKRLGRQGRMPAQLIGAFGLTSTAAAAYYIASGKLDHVAIALWLANWLFAGDQIHFVQLRIHGGRATTVGEKLSQGRAFLVGQMALIAVILGASYVGFFPAVVGLAFAPIVVRGIAWFVRPQSPLNVHKLGFAELAHALIFGLLLSATFVI